MQEYLTRWTFVIDTDSYAGNFERPMCAYVCGQADEFMQSMFRPYLDMFNTEMGLNVFEDLVESRLTDPGDDGYHRSPVDIYPTPGTEKPGKEKYNSVGIFLSRRPKKKELMVFATRARAYSKLPPVMRNSDCRPKILGFRLVKEETTATSEVVNI